MHDEEAIFRLLTAFEILIRKGKHEWASNLQLHEHHSYFRKMMLAMNMGRVYPPHSALIATTKSKSFNFKNTTMTTKLNQLDPMLKCKLCKPGSFRCVAIVTWSIADWSSVTEKLLKLMWLLDKIVIHCDSHPYYIPK